MALTKNDTQRQVQELGYSQKDSAEIVETLLEIKKTSLENGEDVLFPRFGKFAVKDKSSRRCRNPSTGEDMHLDARQVVAFKCSGRLREKISRDG